MDCRLCGAKCENNDPRFQQLCRICGAKREAYVCALISRPSNPTPGSGPQGSDLTIDRIFEIAEKIVKRDRDANT